MTRRAGIALVALVFAVACAGADRAATHPVSDSVYVEVMARLVLLDSVLTPRADLRGAGSRADSLRGRVLETWGVDADQLLDYARTRGTSPKQMQEIWRRVHELSDSLETAGWRPSDALPDTAGAAGDTLGDAAAPRASPGPA